MIPDAEGLCARSYADCNNPEVMFYTVFACANASEVYEEREYRCYGQWEEDDGLVYTYTERVDLPGSECFVGVTLDADTNVVTEAGTNCERGHRPLKYGMTLERQGKCAHEKTSSSIEAVSDGELNYLGVEEREEEQQNELAVSSERPVSPRLSNVNVRVVDNRGHSRHKHNNHRHKNRNNSDDLWTNEIPGSAAPSSSSSSSVVKGSLVLLSIAATLNTWMVSRTKL